MSPRTVFLLLGFLALWACAEQVNTNLLNKNIERSIDITTHIVRQNVTMEITNTGSTSASVIHLAIEADKAERLSLLDVFDSTGRFLDVQKGNLVEDKPKSYVLYEVKLAKPLEASGTTKIVGHFIFTQVLKPFPTHVAQNERQLVEYHGNHYFFSPYQTQTQTTNVKLGSTRIESKGELRPTSVKGDSIAYGPYENIKPLSFSAQRIHYENNSPFLTVRKLVKTIEISHWGNVAVEEDYVIEHTGAKLKGQFSRYDYQRNPYGAATVIPMMRQRLPLYASDPYYRDEIGNVTTSFFSEPAGAAPLLELVPRFPLFGGWKFGFYIGYNLPTYHYLFTSYDDSSLHILNITFGTSFDFAAIDEVVVKIILPEGAKSPEAHVPFGVDKESTEKHYTYLDTAGRPVIVLEKKNVVSDHNRFFQVTYRFSSLALLHEPLLLIFGFFLVFLGIMVWVRLDFYIGPVKQRTAQTDKVDDLLIRFKDIVDQRTEIHSSLDGIASTAVRNRSVSTFENERKVGEATLASLRKLAFAIAGEVEELDNDLGRKLREIEKKEEAKAALLNRLRELEVEQINKKGGKKYEDEKASLERQIGVADDELDAVVNDVFEH